MGHILPMLRTARSRCQLPLQRAADVFSQPVPVATGYGITDRGRRALQQYDARAPGDGERRSRSSERSEDRERR